MITYVTVGVEDMTLAEPFYSSFLLPLGYRLDYVHGELSYALPSKPGQPPIYPDFYVKRPFNGQPASAGNGTMVAFEAKDRAQVRALHAAAVEAGGTDEGAPGTRAAYGPGFYVGYLRDSQGNKIALYASSSMDQSQGES